MTSSCGISRRYGSNYHFSSSKQTNHNVSAPSPLPPTTPRSRSLPTLMSSQQQQQSQDPTTAYCYTCSPPCDPPQHHCSTSSLPHCCPQQQQPPQRPMSALLFHANTATTTTAEVPPLQPSQSCASLAKRCSSTRSSLAHAFWTPIWNCVKPPTANTTTNTTSTTMNKCTIGAATSAACGTPLTNNSYDTVARIVNNASHVEEEDYDLAMVVRSSSSLSCCATPAATQNQHRSAASEFNKNNNKNIPLPSFSPCHSAPSTSPHQQLQHSPSSHHFAAAAASTASHTSPPSPYSPYAHPNDHNHHRHHYPSMMRMPPSLYPPPQPFLLSNLSSSFDASDSSSSSSTTASSSASSSSASSSLATYPPLPIWQPNANDVLCGRGGGSNNPHLGNARFCQLVDSQREYYLSLPTKKQKMACARMIVDVIRDVGGRFLARGDHPSAAAAAAATCHLNMGATSGWYDIGLARSLEKASQALRDKPTHKKQKKKSISGSGGVEKEKEALSDASSSVSKKSMPSQKHKAEMSTHKMAISNRTYVVTPSLMDTAWTDSSIGSSTDDTSQSPSWRKSTLDYEDQNGLGNDGGTKNQDKKKDTPTTLQRTSLPLFSSAPSSSHSCATSTASATCSEATAKMNNHKHSSMNAILSTKHHPYGHMLPKLLKLPPHLQELYGSAVKQLMEDARLVPLTHRQQPQSLGQPFHRTAPQPLPSHDFDPHSYPSGQDHKQGNRPISAPPLRRNNSTPTPIPAALVSPSSLVRPSSSSLIPKHNCLVPHDSPGVQRQQNQPLTSAYPMPCKNNQRTSPHPLQQQQRSTVTKTNTIKPKHDKSENMQPMIAKPSPEQVVTVKPVSVSSPARQQVWKRPRTQSSADVVAHDYEDDEGEGHVTTSASSASSPSQEESSDDSLYTDDDEIYYDYFRYFDNHRPLQAPTCSSLTSASFRESKLSLQDRVIRAPGNNSNHNNGNNSNHNNSRTPPALLPPSRVVGRQPQNRSPGQTTTLCCAHGNDDGGDGGELAALSTTEFLRLDEVGE